PRVPCRIEAKVCIAGSENWLRGTVSDISVDGCYVEMISPLPVDAPVDGNHRSPLGKTGAHFRVFSEAVAQSVQLFGDFLSAVARHVLCTGVNFNAGNDSCIGDSFNLLFLIEPCKPASPLNVNDREIFAQQTAETAESPRTQLRRIMEDTNCLVVPILRYRCATVAVSTCWPSGSCT
ncbi:MAG TPA: hypothetical protein VND66_04670, partial [Acidobacteriaceae bacterium]|nr:hypothetical protein [Acidobacteriaceae bacterium]